jgi:hypothetical protein
MLSVVVPETVKRDLLEAVGLAPSVVPLFVTTGAPEILELAFAA